MSAPDSTPDKTGKGIHPSSSLEIAQRKIQALGLSEEESKMIDAIEIMMKQYSQESMENIEQRFENFETSIKPYFEKMVGEHLVSINEGLNQFLSVIKKESVTPKELKKSMEDLMEVVNSDAIEEIKKFTPDQLQALHSEVVEPLKEHIGLGINTVMRNVNTTHDNIVEHTKALAQQLSDRIADSKAEIKQSLGEVKSSISAMKLPRTFQ